MFLPKLGAPRLRQPEKFKERRNMPGVIVTKALAGHEDEDVDRAALEIADRNIGQGLEAEKRRLRNLESASL